MKLLLLYSLVLLAEWLAATSYAFVEMQLPFLAPAVGPSSVSLLCRRRENGKSRDHPSGKLCRDSSRIGNSSYAIG